MVHSSGYNARATRCAVPQVAECKACQRGMARGWTWTNDESCDSCNKLGDKRRKAELREREPEPENEQDVAEHMERIR